MRSLVAASAALFLLAACSHSETYVFPNGDKAHVISDVQPNGSNVTLVEFELTQVPGVTKEVAIDTHGNPFIEGTLGIVGNAAAGGLIGLGAKAAGDASRVLRLDTGVNIPGRPRR